MDFYLTALLQGLCFSGIALGIYISMKIFNIPDITTDGSYTLGGVVTATLIAGIQLTKLDPKNRCLDPIHTAVPTDRGVKILPDLPVIPQDPNFFV